LIEVRLCSFRSGIEEGDYTCLVVWFWAKGEFLMYSEAVILTPDCTISEDCFTLITSAFGRLNLLGESCGLSM
jgi:hypothetical protein